MNLIRFTHIFPNSHREDCNFKEKTESGIQGRRKCLEAKKPKALFVTPAVSMFDFMIIKHESIRKHRQF